MQNISVFNFLEPVDLRQFSCDDSLLLDLIATQAFQRLRSIRFLGGIDYLLVKAPNGVRGNIRYTRHQHSLGVARLATLYCDSRGMSRSNRRLVCVAALLHDIGHPPLSHSLEPIFAEVFGLEHHRATEAIITGAVPIGREVYKTLRRHRVDVEHLVAIISGAAGGYEGFFSGPINFDTIEGILRSYTYTTIRPKMPSPEAVTEAALRRSDEEHRRIVDAFWSLKDQVYRCIINSRSGILADFACQLFMKRNLDKLGLDDYFATEVEIFRKLDGLRKLLASRSFETEIIRQLDRPLAYKVRRFFVEPNTDFFARDDKARYKQTKEDRLLPFRDLDALPPAQLDRDLFDDESNSTGEAVFRTEDRIT